MSSLDLERPANTPTLARINRLPIVIIVTLLVVFSVVVIWGLAGRGIGGRGYEDTRVTGQPASDLAEAITQGVRPGIVQAPSETVREPLVLDPSQLPAPTNPFQEGANGAPSPDISQIDQPAPVPSDSGWQDRLERELAEARMREEHRQQLAAIQASHTAASSPLQIDLSKIDQWQNAPSDENEISGQSLEPLGRPDQDLLTGYEAAIDAGRQALGLQMPDAVPNGMRSGGGSSTTRTLTPARSRYEIKRGSVIPATLISAINSDLPGPITAQVGQNVFDSATGHHLLIPQGSRLIGNYQSDVGFGQRRVFVVWSDIVFPDGSSLSLGQLSGVDVGGRAGFSDRVDNRYIESFGAAALVALIGTGVDLASPRPQQTTFSDPWEAGRSNLAQSMGELAQQTISRNLDVAPTLEIRSGYRFNVFVEHDIAFPGSYFSDREGASQR